MRGRYLWYVLRHKWFVLQAGLRLGVPLWQLIIHDWSKLLPCEFLPYARFFYGGPHRPWAEVTAYEKLHHFDRAWSRSQEGIQDAFDRAWLHHQNVNPHHWNYWLLRLDDGNQRALSMPDRFVREMVADWTGAGRALGKPDIAGWYQANCHRMTMHPQTRQQAEALLGIEAEEKSA